MTDLLTTPYMERFLRSHDRNAKDSAIYNFWYEFNNENKKKFKIARSHFGSYLAFGMASYNLYHMKQKIIKNTIYLTRSKNPKIIKTGSAFLSMFYFVGLLSVWHIPSLSIQMAYNLFFASMSGTLNYLNPPRETLENFLNDETLVKKTLKEIEKL